MDARAQHRPPAGLNGGLGCNNFGSRIDLGRAKEVVAAALDAGITLFDTADVYGRDGASEEMLGEALDGRRNQVLVATKYGRPMGDDPAQAGASARWTERALEASLRRLSTDHIDLYQLHYPDDATPIGETLEALGRCVLPAGSGPADRQVPGHRPRRCLRGR